MKKRNRFFSKLLCFIITPNALLLAVALPSASAEAAPDSSSVEGKATGSEVEKFFSDAEAYISGRYRFEFVDQSGFDENAKASTLRTRLGFISGEVYGFSMKLEFEDVSAIGGETYNSTVNDNAEYPVVADPEVTLVNEIYGSLSAVPDTVLRGGREALTLDNLRFIGDVGWRQNNQTFDGVNLLNESIEDLKIFYGYVSKVNRIFGPDSPVGTFNTNLNLVNAGYSGFGEVLKATVYTYLYDVKSNDNLSTANFGARIYGKYPAGEDLNLLYDGEYAYQRDFEDNPLDFAASYWRAELGAGLDEFSVTAAYEVLGSDDGVVGFSTPFATLHKWNGWADKFLLTPEDGLQDAYAGLHYVSKDLCEGVQQFRGDIVYHYFQSDHERVKYGTEWDFNLTADFLNYFSAGVKYAVYDAANFSSDTEKLIFTLQAVFRH